MKTKEQIIKRLKEDADAYLVANNVNQELAYLNDMRSMLWFLD